jgi:hypothetical protein
MIAPYVISFILLALAAGCAQGIFHWTRKARTMSRWPTVMGKITSTWDTLDGSRITYAYNVAGHSYVGHRISWPAGSTADPTAQELTEKYPPGSDVTVYYDPSRPTTAVLEPRNLQNAIVSTVFTVAFAGFGLVVLGAALR